MRNMRNILFFVAVLYMGFFISSFAQNPESKDRLALLENSICELRAEVQNITELKRSQVPFGSPIYDSGWRITHPSRKIILTHNIGGDPNNYVVDLQIKSGATGSIGNWMIGGVYYFRENAMDLVEKGAYWSQLNEKTIAIFRNKDDISTGDIRIRIWKYDNMARF